MRKPNTIVPIEDSIVTEIWSNFSPSINACVTVNRLYLAVYSNADVEVYTIKASSTMCSWSYVLMEYPQEHCAESSSKNKAGRLQPLLNGGFRMTASDGRWHQAGARIGKWDIHLLKTVAVEHVWAIAAAACSGEKSTSRPGSSGSDSKFFWAAVMCRQSLYKLLQVIVKKFYLILGQDLQLHFPK